MTSDLYGMTTTTDTFIYLKRDIEQSFQRLQKLSNSSNPNQQEINQLLNHISCTLDDLQKVNIPSKENTLSDSENDDQEETSKLQKHFTISYSKDNEEFIHQMKTQYDYYKNKIPSSQKNEGQMEIIRLDQPADDEDSLIRKQDDQLEDIHHSIISLKNLTQNINFEINDHIRVLDNLETDMVKSHNRIENLTKRTKNFIRTSGDGVGGHTCLFCTAVGLFFLIVILILFF